MFRENILNLSLFVRSTKNPCSSVVKSYPMKSPKRHSKFYVYMVRCRDGSLYTGYTSDLDRRIKEHHNSRGARYLKGKMPLKLVWCKEYKYYKRAVQKERRVKKMTRRQKEELVRIYENGYE